MNIGLQVEGRGLELRIPLRNILEGIIFAYVIVTQCLRLWYDLSIL